MPQPTKGLGFKPDPLKDASPSFAKLRLARAGEVGALSLEQHIPTVNGKRIILDQGGTSSCVAHAFVGAIHICEQRAGLSHIPASRRYAYAHARLKEGRGVPLEDNGTYCRTCAEGAHDHGIPDERFMPFDEAKINELPEFDAIAEAHPRAGGKYARIYEYAADRSQAIKAAIGGGHPVVFGTLVADSFLDAHGPVHIEAPRATEPIAGGHAMCLLGWKTESGRTWFRTLNSWGAGWRDGGLAWLSEEYVASINTTDLHIVYGWKRLQQAP
jgi:C1A family cysteine protease